jgi:hypothetical protein
MTTLNNAFGMEYAPTSFTLRFGRREVLVTRDFRKRFYAIPVSSLATSKCCCCAAGC